MQTSVSQLDQLPIELRCLIACCQEEPSIAEVKLVSDTIHKSGTAPCISLAQKHGILPLLYQTVKNISNREQLVDNSAVDLLKQAYLLTARSNMFMSAELLRIAKLFEANGLEMMAFKGPALAQEGYRDVTLREFSDLDILVKKADRSKAIQLLIEEGYIPEINLKIGTEAYFYDTVNVLGLYHAKTNLLIEVHWELLSKTYAIHWEEESLWQRKHSLVLNRQTIRVLSPEVHLLYLCIHGAKHLFERLEWINDINRFIRSHPEVDWNCLWELAAKQHTERMLLLGLNIAKKVCKVVLPSSIQIRLDEDQNVEALTATLLKVHIPHTLLEGKDISYPKMLWTMREKPRDRLRFLWHMFASPTIDDFKFVQLPRYLRALYPFIRVYRLSKKYL
jgi:hypothetical protein